MILKTPSVRVSSAPATRIYGRDLRLQGGRAVLAFRVDGLQHDRLRFDLDERYADLVGDDYDSAAVGLLVPALESGKPLAIDGNMSARLLWNINHHVVRILQMVLPETGWDGDICWASEPEDGGEPAGRFVLTAISNGIDSLTACLDHLGPDTPSPFRVTHLMFNDVGGHGRSEKRNRIRNARWERARATADELGLPIIDVNSNLDDFYTTNFRRTSTLRNASVALAFQRGARRWLCASAHDYSQLRVGATPAIGYADAALLPTLSTERMEMVSTGTQYSRVEKTARIADEPIAWRRLDVCAVRERNCSRCWKCLRTLLTLDLLGKLENFSEVFDLSAYAKAREGYIAKVLASRDPLLIEVRDLMSRVGYRPDASVRARAAAIGVKEAARPTVSRLRGTLRSSSSRA